MVQELVRPGKLQKGAAPDSAWAYLGGKFVPIREAKISVMTHAFNYGTGVFEGVRAYWNAEEEQLYGLNFRDHYARLTRSCKILRLTLPHSVEDLVDITVELLRKCGYREDAYIRPVVFKSSELIGVRLHNLEDDFTVFAVPFGNYVSIDGGISVQVSSWRRVDDGHVSEGSSANLFLVRDGRLITTPATDNILEGIVRSNVMRIAADEKIPVDVRRVDRTELYQMDEAFLCGTGVQISPITSIDHRPLGDGEVGPIARRISRIYFEAVRGKNAKYKDWLTPIYPAR